MHSTVASFGFNANDCFEKLGVSESGYGLSNAQLPCSQFKAGYAADKNHNALSASLVAFASMAAFPPIPKVEESHGIW